MRHQQRIKHSKYQWPADKLTEKEMAMLYEWRKKTKIPINLLLARAVKEMDKVIRTDGLVLLFEPKNNTSHKL